MESENCSFCGKAVCGKPQECEAAADCEAAMVGRAKPRPNFYAALEPGDWEEIEKGIAIGVGQGVLCRDLLAKLRAALAAQRER